MPTADLLATRLQELKAAAQASLTLARTGNPIPTRVYRSHGRPAVDVLCAADDGLLAVYLADPAVDLQRVEHGRAINVGQHGYMALVRAVVEIWRCVPTQTSSGPPSATALDVSAEELARDGHALWTGLHLRREAGTLFPTAGNKVESRIGDPKPLAPRGGAAGWQITVEVGTTDVGAPPL